MMKLGEKDLPLGFEVKSCRECKRNNLGMMMLNQFEMPNPFFYTYDEKRGVLQINESVLMSMIRSVNPYQEECPLELVKDAKGKLVVTAGRKE